VGAVHELVIFDCDGVLVDSEPIANRVFAEQLRAVGLSMSVDDVMARFVGKTRAGCLDLAAKLFGRPLPEGFGQSWDTALFQALACEVRTVKGVSQLLDTLEIPYCVASNSIPERTRVSLKAVGLLPRFEGRIFSASDVPRPKPAPDLFLHAAKAMNATPSRTVVVEDTITGVLAGVAAGMTVLAYAPDQTHHPRVTAHGGIPFTAMNQVTSFLARGSLKVDA
jgi:HAD superfamily hydrolase (TIGR01509 family)